MCSSMIRKLKVIVYFRKVFLLSKFKYFCFVTILDMSLISRSCKNDHIIKRSIKLETAVTWSKSNLNMMNIYEESTLNFWICGPPAGPKYIHITISKVFLLSKFKYFCFVTILDMSLISRSCKNDHIIFNVGTPSLEARNIRFMCVIFWTWKWYIESSWIKWNTN
jgi:hypothetical protein